MNVEHLSFLPPIGLWHRAEVEDDAEGHSELVMYGHYLELRRAQDSVLQNAPDDAPEGPSTISDASIGIEPRNFEPAEWATLHEDAPLPLTERAARSSLPPLIWLLSVPVAWGAAAFSGSFLKRLGEEAASSLISWIKERTARARGNDRDALVQVNFEVGDLITVSAFVPLDQDSSDNVNSLREGLEGLGRVASFAGWMSESGGPSEEEEVRLVAFFYRDSQWHLAWWATPEEAYLTKWFEQNCPDPQRFLDRPRLVAVDGEETDATKAMPLLEHDQDDALPGGQAQSRPRLD
ncbi:hypothetical protein [Qaidamihabitans albus]|uniref:hypothetical protein n=1 Tax=Qaidamihabitans albus TaxID=2795733 RepID=UPI0018F1BAFD|nr:hypothetical protein [Qaidamihabitans albus]